MSLERNRRLLSNQGQDPSGGGPTEIPLSREALIERWKNAPEELKKYPAKPFTDSEGNVLYEYPKGTRLLILGEEVMDSCQTPWAEATVRHAFQALGNKRNVNVLERGFGLGIVATNIIDHLEDIGGTYTCIELNEEVARYADTIWQSRLDASAHAKAISVRGGTYTGLKVPINIIHGDAYEKTKRLAEVGKQFDLIVSDTFPLSERERSMNDLLDMEILKHCLTPDGVFTFFGYFTGSEGGIGPQQRDVLAQHFESYGVAAQVTVNPPPDYKYFNPSTGPIRRLPVIICKQPIFE